MQIGKKKAHKPKLVTKPYMTGGLTDSATVKNALKFFGSLLIMAVLFLLLGSVLLWDSLWLRIITNSVVMALAYLLFYSTGATAGTAAVGTGEIMYQRQESGRTVSPQDQASCYNAGKGYITALAGTIPLLLCTAALAIMAQRQVTGLSTLPSWLGIYERRAEIGDALAFYHTSTAVTLVDVLRIIVRMTLMPLVSIVGTDNPDGLLVLERLSPLLSLVPVLVYGFGYTRGVSMRTRVHSQIASNTRKRARKEKKKQQARVAKKPEQLN